MTTPNTPTFGGFFLDHSQVRGLHGIDLGPDRDTLPSDLPPVVRLSGGFAEDLPEILPERSRERNPRPKTGPREEINPNRTFFVQGGVDEGGFRQNWSRWRIVRDDTGTIRAVDVIYTELRDSEDRLISVDKIQLEGADAFNFLKLVGDRNREAFSRPRPAQTGLRA